VQPGEPG